MGSDAYEQPRYWTTTTAAGTAQLSASGPTRSSRTRSSTRTRRIGRDVRILNAAGVVEAEDSPHYVIRDKIVVIPKHTVLPTGSCQLSRLPSDRHDASSSGASRTRHAGQEHECGQAPATFRRTRPGPRPRTTIPAVCLQGRVDLSINNSYLGTATCTTGQEIQVPLRHGLHSASPRGYYYVYPGPHVASRWFWSRRGYGTDHAALCVTAPALEG